MAEIRAFPRAGVEPDSDADAMLRVRCGDSAAFDLLVGRYERQIIGFLVNMLGDRDEALDGSQEVFVRIYTRADRYDPDAPFKAWLYRIATNVGIDLIRKRRRRRWVGLTDSLFKIGSQEAGDSAADSAGLSEEPADKASHALTELLDQETSTVVRSAISTLPEKYRTALVLRDLQELGYDEIARVLDCRVGTVKSRVNRARNLLRDKLSSFQRSSTNAEAPNEVQ